MAAEFAEAVRRRGIGFVISSAGSGGVVPAVIEPDAAPSPALVPRARRRRRATVAAMELEIDVVAVKIGRDANAGVITAVIEALKATR